METAANLKMELSPAAFGTASRFTWRHHLMKSLKGVIHVGANTEQECDEYGSYGLNVLWIEPIPRAFSTYPNQQALEYLVLDEDDETKKLHVSNNDSGLSSSILELTLHRDVCPSVHFTRDIKLRSHKLDTIIDREHINLSNYDSLVVDTQGSQLLVLKGAQRVLQTVRMVKVAVADFEAYAGCARPEQIADFLRDYGLRKWTRIPLAKHSSGGYYYDIYLRK